MASDNRSRVRELAEEYLGRKDPTGWFEALYASASADASTIPWADLRPNPNLMEWLARNKLDGTGKRALSIGCGLGDDADELARIGFDVTGFDISATAIEWCKKRFPESRVKFVAADLLNPPNDWRGYFDFVQEAYTVQALPLELRQQAIERIASFVAPGGTLLVICRAREPEEPVGQLPWPLTKLELEQFKKCRLGETSFEDYMEDEDPPLRRFRVVYRREK